MCAETNANVCRICLESEADAGKLLCPCKCSGSQAYIHLNCIRQWQSSVGITSPRAGVCSVCNSPYKGVCAPPRESLIEKLYRWLKESYILVAVIACLLAISDPLISWPVSAILLYCNSSGIMPVLVGNRVRLIRQGNPVIGLTRGVFLVAAGNMPPGSIFHESVILLLEHDSRWGSMGVIVNDLQWEHVTAIEEDVKLRYWRGIGLGGPVPSHQLHSLHDVPGVVGGRSLVAGHLYETLVGGELALARMSPDSAASIAVASICRNIHSKLLSNHRGEKESRDQEESEATTKADADAAVRETHIHHHMIMLERVASWGARQLDGEVRAGAWNYVDATPELAGLIFDQTQNRSSIWRVMSRNARGLHDVNVNVNVNVDVGD